MIPDDDEGEHVEDDAANLEAVLDPEEGEGGEGEAAPVDEDQAGEEVAAAEEGGEAPAEDVEGDFPVSSTNLAGFWFYVQRQVGLTMATVVMEAMVETVVMGENRNKE